ncbi:MAG: AmmeMemoRadiSam system protein A [Limisphaerales bacterium]
MNPLTGDALDGPAILLQPAEMSVLLDLAREALEMAVIRGVLPEETRQDVPGRLREEHGCFVTLTRRGTLRGCIGNVFPAGPLVRKAQEHARAAALHDPRFGPVTPMELPEIDVEVSVLTAPVPVAFASPDQLCRLLRPGQDGVVLRVGARTATFLPQVWEKLPNPEEFLNRLAQKAGCRPDVWKSPEAQLMTYEAQCIGGAEAG